MNIYELEAGRIRRFVVAESEEEARAIGHDPEKHPDLHFRPFTVRKVEVEGYTITVTPNEAQEGEDAPKRGKRKAAV